MPATLCDISLEIEQLMYQAAADSAFRANLANDPEIFGTASRNLLLPDSVEQHEQTELRIWSEGITAMRCSSTCSQGPFTVVCDGSTK
ncbi:MAG: cinnamycin family lantibiotic [Ktedonobacteraceae bacterium]